MDLTKEGIEHLEREDYLGLVTSVTGHLFATIHADRVDVELKTPDGAILAVQSYGIDVLDLLGREENLAVGSTDLITKLYSRNLPFLLKAGKSAFYIPEEDTRIARALNWLYGKFTKEKYDAS